MVSLELCVLCVNDKIEVCVVPFSYYQLGPVLKPLEGTGRQAGAIITLPCVTARVDVEVEKEGLEAACYLME